MNRQKQGPLAYSDQRLVRELLVLDPENPIGHTTYLQLAMRPEQMLKAKQRVLLMALRDAASTRQAKELLRHGHIRAWLCPALSGTKDIHHISAVITPVLIEQVVAGTLSIPLIPVLFASLAREIESMGVSTFCATEEKQDEET
jgi:hypothetical protein